MSRPRLTAAIVTLCALLAPGQALAAANHPFLGIVGPAGYQNACGLAFGPGGLFVSNYGADAIEGPTTIAGEAPQGGPCKLAFDSAGDLYVNNWHRDVVRYEAGHLATGAYEVIDPERPNAAEAPTGLAVDPVSGDLYVAHRTFIAKYNNPPHETEAPILIGADASAAYYGIAYSNFPATQGRLYVPDAATHTVKVFDSSTATELEGISGEAGPQGGFRNLLDSEALLDDNPSSPSYGHLYVLDNLGTAAGGAAEGALDEFNSEGDYRGQVKNFTDAGPSGIAIEAATGNVLVTSGGSEGSAVFKYGPTAPARKLTVAKTGSGGGTVRSQPAGIACGAACAAEFDQGAKVELFAAPDAHSVFRGWSGGGCVGAGSCTLLMSAAAEVQAEFEEPTQETLSVSVTGAGEGSVTSEPAGLSCPGTCVEDFNEGRLVTLTAVPASGSRFVEWLGVGCDEGTQPTCQIAMGHAESIAARFEPIPVQALAVSVTGSGQGTVTSEPSGISCPPLCGAGFGEGSEVTLIASAAPGSDFAGWSGACSGTASACTVTMSAAQSLGAEFEPRPPGAPPGTVGSIPCEFDECAPLPVAPEDPTISSLVPGASNPPVHFPPKRCPKGKRRVMRKGQAVCVATGHRRHRKKHR
jgi:DNA-binding beta-propeller fold protein YncE